MSMHIIFRDDEVIIALNGFPYTVSVDDSRYDDVCDAIDEHDEQLLETLLSKKQAAFKMYDVLEEKGIEEDGIGNYTYMGTPIAMNLTDYLRVALDNEQYMPIVKFIQRLYENPNHDTRMRLFEFMEKNKLPIDDDGCFLAFKVVQSNYKDKHTGKVDNSPGISLKKLSWSEVDTNPENTCSRGYHACSNDYLSSFYSSGDRVVSVSIAPEDVGSIPDDYNNAKLRCRGYTVVADITDQYIREQEYIQMRGGAVNPFNFRAEYRRYMGVMY